MADYCTKMDANCFTNLPLITVISQWLRENSDLYIDINPVFLIYIGFTCLIAWIVFKMFFRMIKSMFRPILFIAGIMIIIYTKQFSYSESPVDFVFDVLGNTIILFAKILDTISRIFFGQPVVL